LGVVNATLSKTRATKAAHVTVSRTAGTIILNCSLTYAVTRRQAEPEFPPTVTGRYNAWLMFLLFLIEYVATSMSIHSWLGCGVGAHVERRSPAIAGRVGWALA